MEEDGEVRRRAGGLGGGTWLAGGDRSLVARPMGGRPLSALAAGLQLWGVLAGERDAERRSSVGGYLGRGWGWVPSWLDGCQR